MNQTPKRILSPVRIAIFGCVILAMLHVILLGGTYLRQNAAKTLQDDRAAIEQNYTEMIGMNEEQRSTLQTQLEVAHAEVADLQASFPNLGAPFAIYPRGMDLSRSSDVNLQSISSISKDFQETVSGTIQTERYSVELNGSLISCLTFIKQLEQASLDTVGLEYATFWPEEELCSLEIITVGHPPTAE